MMQSTIEILLPNSKQMSTIPAARIHQNPINQRHFYKITPQTSPLPFPYQTFQQVAVIDHIIIQRIWDCMVNIPTCNADSKCTLCCWFSKAAYNSSRYKKNDPEILIAVFFSNAVAILTSLVGLRCALCVSITTNCSAMICIGIQSLTILFILFEYCLTSSRVNDPLLKCYTKIIC